MVSETRSIFIVEDHPRMRQMLRQLVKGVIGFTVVGEAESAETALVQLTSPQPDPCLVDLSLPGMSGLELVKHLHKQESKLRCLVVTGHSDPLYQSAALAAGAAGYITKDDPDAVLEGIRAVLRQ